MSQLSKPQKGSESSQKSRVVIIRSQLNRLKERGGQRQAGVGATGSKKRWCPAGFDWYV